MASSLPSLVLLSVLLLVNFRKGDGQEFDWCRLKCRRNVPHTMCKYQPGGPDRCSGASNGLTDAEKQTILLYHNKLRAKVARGEELSQPSASDMNELLWDDELAEVAQRWIEQCQFSLEHDKCRIAKNGEEVGQNLAVKWSTRGVPDRSSTLKKLIRGWYDEVKLFDKSLINGWWNSMNQREFGHYTAMVWASTTHVGCGVYTNTSGRRGELKLACNYRPGGNVVGQPVYTVGVTASECTSKSERYPGLCST